MKVFVFSNFVCIPVTSNAQAHFPREPGFGSGREAELFVHLERVKAHIITFQIHNVFQKCEANNFPLSLRKNYDNNKNNSHNICLKY